MPPTTRPSLVASRFTTSDIAPFPHMRFDRAMLGYGAAYVLVSLMSLGIPWLRPVLVAGFFPIGLITAWTMWRVVREATGADRAAWMCIAISCLLFWSGGQLWTLAVAQGTEFPLDNWFDGGATLLLIAGLVQFPSAPSTWWRDRRVLLDATLLLVALLAMVWHFAVQPIADTANLTVFHLLVTWPELFVAAWVYLRVGDHPRRAAIALLFGAAAVSATADFLWEALQSRYLPGDWLDTPWFIAWMMRWYGARTALVVAYRTGRAEPATVAPPAARLIGRRGITPSVFVAGVYCSLVIAAVLGRTGSMLSLGVAASVLTVLLLVRQAVELRDTQRLARDATAQAVRFRSLLEQSSDLVMVVDANLRTTFTSPSVTRARMLQVGDAFLDAVAPAAQGTVSEWLHSMSNDARVTPLPMRVRLRVGDGDWREFDVRAQDRRSDERVRGWVITGRDQSEATGLERRLRHSEKLGALHDMAGRIAHAFNNLLSSVLGHAELMANELAPGTPWREDVMQMHAAATRGAAITRQLLGFSDTHQARPVVLDAVPLTHELLPTLRRLLPDDITVQEAHQTAPVLVRVDRSQLEQVITNLVTNARDAMPNGGAVTLRWHTEGGQQRLLVHDEGTGMPPDVLARVFDPFYTTKSPGRGTGLGLAMVDAMVRRAGGAVAIDSTVGQGTRVVVTLPAAEWHADHRTTPGTIAVVPDVLLSGKARILLVDDEASVRRVGRRLLERVGHHVTEADGGLAAAAIIQDLSIPIDLLLTDMMMPGLSGRDVIQLCRQRRPDVPIICVTGFAAITDDDATPLADLVFQVVEKPFSGAVLTGAVSAAMASRSPGQNGGR